MLSMPCCCAFQSVLLCALYSFYCNALLLCCVVLCCVMLCCVMLCCRVVLSRVPCSVLFSFCCNAPLLCCGKAATHGDAFSLFCHKSSMLKSIFVYCLQIFARKCWTQYLYIACKFLHGKDKSRKTDCDELINCETITPKCNFALVFVNRCF